VAAKAWKWKAEKGERGKKRRLINRIIGNGDFRKLTGARGDMEAPRFYFKPREV